MRTTLLRCFVVLFALRIVCLGQTGAPLETVRQLVVVTTPDWNTSNGTLQLFERNDAGWSRVGGPIQVVVGRSGLGWGSGFHASAAKFGDPVKREGDGRSPAGVFPIGAAFGFDPEKPDWLKLAYISLTSATECVDDPSSRYYNAVVDRVATVKSDWSSSEKMRSIGVYRWGVVVNQNTARQPGAGSCIFLHIWSGPEQPTAGCTAMEQGNLEQLMGWLDERSKPLMVTLPRREYERLRSQWQLP